MSEYYLYGGMKFTQHTKLHICNDKGVPLCGVKSNWMEAGEPINNAGFVKGEEHLFPITNPLNNPCKKCLTKWKVEIKFGG